MQRRILLMLGAGLGIAPAAAASAWPLVSEADARRDRAAGPGAATRGVSLPGGPQIAVDRPASEAGLAKPFSVRIRFVPPADAAVDPTSFRAGYGWLNLDITARLLAHATLTAAGLSADDIDAPAGQHRVTISIADTLGRSSSRTFRFTIA
jgi:hypothetical protein